MKRIVIILAAILLLPGLSQAQGNGKDKEKDKTKSNGNGNGQAKVKEDKGNDKTDKQKHESAIWEGTKDAGGGGPKPSKNQPAKVRAAFARDYPNASSVSWSKYRGDWTATFHNGPFWSTAIYHANGNRRDTRTQIPRSQFPVKIEDIFKKKPELRIEDIIKIEVPPSPSPTPTKPSLLYRVKTWLEGKTKYQYVNEAGVEVQYNY